LDLRRMPRGGSYSILPASPLFPHSALDPYGLDWYFADFFKE
jgi:hypothetical protein